MQLILVLTAATGLGWFLGSRPAFGKRALRAGRPVMLASIALLLFAMGFSLGSNPGIVSQIGALGVQSLSLAISGGFGAVFSVRIARHFLRKVRRDGGAPA